MQVSFNGKIRLRHYENYFRFVVTFMMTKIRKYTSISSALSSLCSLSSKKTKRKYHNTNKNKSGSAYYYHRRKCSSSSSPSSSCCALEDIGGDETLVSLQ